MLSRATTSTTGDLTIDLEVSEESIVVEAIVVANLNALQAAIIEFENKNGTIIMTMIVQPKSMEVMSEEFLADKGLIVALLDEDIVVTVFHSAGAV